MTQAFQVFRLLGKWLVLPAQHQRLAAHVEDPVLDDLELAKLPDELDVAQHLALGQKLGLKLVFARLVPIVEGYVGLGPALQF